MKNKIKILLIIFFTPLVFGNSLSVYSNDCLYELVEEDLDQFVINSFTQYNKDIDRKTILKFIEVCDSFNLRPNIKTLTAQICLESGAKHTIQDTLLESNSSALGICQVTTQTAFLFLKNIISKDDRLLKKLGGTKYRNILEIEDPDERREGIKKWLSNETNNIIIYGYMMGRFMNKYKDIRKSLVVYAHGPLFLKNNKNIDSDTYVRSVMNIKKVLNEN